MHPLIPVYRPESASRFVDPSLVEPWMIPGQPPNGLLTSALKFGVKLDLIGISQTNPDNAKVATMIDPAVSLAAIMYRIKDDPTVYFHSFAKDDMVEPFTMFVASPENNYREMKLNYTFDHTVGSTLGQVQVKQKITGTINLELGDLIVNAEAADNIEPLGYILTVNGIDSLAGEDEDDEVEFIPTRIVNLHDIPGNSTPIQINATDEQGSGGAYHVYEVSGLDLKRQGASTPLDPQIIRFQNGPIPDHGHNGVTIEHLLAIAGHRLQCFQAGPFPSDDNAEALGHIKSAIETLNRRTLARIARGVEGKEVK